MKIEKKCSEPLLGIKHLRDIPLGTVFVYGDHSYGPYLRVANGFVDLKTNGVHAGVSYISVFEAYKELPNARLVIE